MPITSGFIKRLKNFRTELMQANKKTLVCLSNTANINNPALYLGGIRETDNTVAVSILFAEMVDLKEVIELFDGFVDCFLIDTEVKNGLSEFSRVALKHIKNSAIHFYKPNDITVDALDEFIACLCGDLEGCSVVVVGIGNIGAKISLRLSERGAKVFLFGREKEKLLAIIKGLDLVKRGNGSLTVMNDLEMECNEVTLLLGCTPGIPVIDETAINSLSPNSIVIDVGNGTISDGGIKAAVGKNIRIYCFNMMGGYNGFIKNWEFTQSHFAKSGRNVLAHDISIITPGILGAYGEIIVDDLEQHNRIIGVCDGKGDVLDEQKAKIFIERLNAHDQRGK